MAYCDGDPADDRAANLRFAPRSRKLTHAQVQDALRLVAHEGPNRAEVARR